MNTTPTEIDWNRVNVWTHTLYTLIHCVSLAKKIDFGNLASLDGNIRDAGNWINPECSYASMLLDHMSGNQRITFRRDPNKHFNETSNHLVKILIQDLVVILDEMMEAILIKYSEKAGPYPQSKIEKLSKRLNSKYLWAAQGCYELVAVRNALTHNGGKWNQKCLQIIPFVRPAPKIGDVVSVGYPMLFRYRKAIRTFLNEVSRT